MEKLPVIDMQGFTGGGFEGIAREIAEACRSVGFFYVVNHGVAPELIRAAFAESQAFFAQPVAAKAALAIERVGGNRGYSGLLHEALDPKAGADLKEDSTSGSTSLRTIQS
jgi:isopenicillin N synthase-like dioxygenase